MSKRQRLDILLVERGLVESRQKARALIMQKSVYVDGEPVTKPGASVSAEAEITIQQPCPYVSRGGLKLQEALEYFGVDVRDRIAVDVGASTGGFTDCLLQKGAKKVYAVDVGYGQLHWRLRNDPRVVVMERTNVRYLKKEDIGEPVDIVTVDVSFISLTKVLPVVKEFLKVGGQVLALVKPQFELQRRDVQKGGVVRSEQKRQEAVEKVCDCLLRNGFRVIGSMRCGLKGQKKGNVEFFVYAIKERSLS